jgi:hypothetical protein
LTRTSPHTPTRKKRLTFDAEGHYELDALIAGVVRRGTFEQFF